ncbi:MAG: ABC transporter permease [Pseudomonadota bacterium]
MFWITLDLAFREIRRNAMRSSLTALGIVIGVAAVITMVTIGSGATAQVTGEIESLGSNLLMVTPGQRMGMGQRTAASALEQADVDAILRDISGIKDVAPNSRQAVSAVFGNNNWSTQATGVDNAYFSVGNWTLVQGRQFLDSELRRGNPVCILGATVRDELFGAMNPLGSRVRLEKLSCQVVGVLESKGQSSMGSDQDDTVLIPLRAFQRRIAGNKDIRNIRVEMIAGANSERVQADIRELLRKRRHIAASEDDDFSVMDMAEITSILTGTTTVLTMLLGAVAGVSLLVGGIGIMNIMLVSVTERTPEIGIRLAIGATEREVLLQFLVEAIVLSSLGGLIGIILALASSAILADVLAVPFVPDPTIVVLAFLFSSAVGVVFGYFPARRAAQLDPIDALRHE